MSVVRHRVVFRGLVQGVGFRASAVLTASRFPVSGFVRNQPDGTVLMEVEGEEAVLVDLVAAIEAETTGEVAGRSVERLPATGEFGPGLAIRR